MMETLIGAPEVKGILILGDSDGVPGVKWDFDGNPDMGGGL